MVYALPSSFLHDRIEIRNKVLKDSNELRHVWFGLLWLVHKGERLLGHPAFLRSQSLNCLIKWTKEKRLPVELTVRLEKAKAGLGTNKYCSFQLR